MLFARGLTSWALVVAFIFSALSANAQDSTNPALIHGIVSKTSNAEPVAGVTVTAVADSGAKYSTTTDVSGTFNLKGIPPGHYFLSASRSGFLPYDRDEHSTGFSVLPGQSINEFRIQLTPTGTIAGRVLDSNRQPVVGATVMAIRPTFVNGRQVLIPDLASTGHFLPMGGKMVPTWEYPKAITDDRGQYRVFGLAPGSYYVSVWSAGAETLDEVTEGINKTPGYTKDQPPIFYPGVSDPGVSIPIRVDGTEREGIDLELRSQILHRFSFQVVPSDSSEPCRGIGDAQEAIVLGRHTPNLDVVQYSSRFGNTLFKKGSDNQWTSPPLPSGSYEVFFNPCMFNSLGMVGTLMTDIVDRDVDAGKLAIPLNGSISGRIQKTDAPAVDFSKVQLRFRPLDLRSASASMVPRFNSPGENPSAPTVFVVKGARIVNSDGTFSFALTNKLGTFPTAAPGLYQIDIAGLPEDVYVASIKLGGREVRDSGFRVDSDPPGPLEISLSQQGGVIDGVVKDRLGKPVADSFVALMPLNRELVFSNLFRDARTGQDGVFTIRGIPPGEYAIVAVEDLEVGESRSAQFLDEYQSRIVKILIKQGSVETVSLTVATR